MSNLQRPQKPPQPAPSNQCLTGCVYQVIQTTGLQGSNVLKLLPILKPKDNSIPVLPSPVTPSASTLNVPQAAISSPPPPVSIISRPSPVSVPLVQTPAFGNYIIAAQNNLTNALRVENSYSVCQERTLFLDNAQLTLPTNSLPGNPTFFMMNTKAATSVRPTPMLPLGHSLQIPAHAEVISVPVSSLPFSIQQKILPQASGTDISKVPSAIYVSPVNTIKANNNPIVQPYSSPNTSSITSGTKLQPQLRPPTSCNEALNGPMKWVVQESQESAACLVPVKSSNDTASKILQMLSKTKMEDVNLTNSDHSKVVQIKDNALVMCNNKIFFLTKKGTKPVNAEIKNLEPPPYSSPVKPAAPIKPMKDLSNRVVQVVLSKNKSPPPSAEQSVHVNVVSTAKPKRKSSTPRPMRGDPSVIYIHDEQDCGEVSVKPQEVKPQEVKPQEVKPQEAKPQEVKPQEVKPPDSPRSLTNPASTTAVKAAYTGDHVKKTDQLLSESQGAEITTTKAPEVNTMDDRSWRLRFGLLKKEKIALKRIPLIRAQGTSQTNSGPEIDPGSVRMEETDPVETQQDQLKRKSSDKQTVKALKKQKSSEGSNVNPNPENPGISTDSPSPASRGYSVTTERSSSTWSPQYYGGDASHPPDCADFQVSRDISGHFSEVSLPRFHIDSFSAMYSDETTKDEKIQRLKEVLKEREQALEALRRPKKT